MYDTILFDLDGTLTDSGLGITNAARYALREMGCPVPEDSVLRKFIGPPLYDSFQRFCAMDEETAMEAVRLFRVYYNDKGILENRVYDGVKRMLERLSHGGKRLVLATSKPETAAVRVMEYFGLNKFVPEIAGATPDPSRSTKGQVIAYCLKQFGIDPASTVMVGDREHDVLGARENGLPCIGITYGYGERVELETAGAAQVFDTPAELADDLLGE